MQQSRPKFQGTTLGLSHVPRQQSWDQAKRFNNFRPITNTVQQVQTVIIIKSRSQSVFPGVQ